MSTYSYSTMSQAATEADGRRSGYTPHQEKPFACTMEWCQHRFDTLSDMQYHKKRDPAHFYCKKCDVDCEDWDSLVTHKIDNMAPYLEKRKEKDDDLKHITCEFCGEDFKSFGGRKRHRTQNHRADQDIECPGCGIAFIRASHFVDHLERNECPNITALYFISRINHKYIIRQVLVGTLASKEDGQYGHEENSRPGAITDGDELLDQDTGGVSLLDEQNEAQLSGYKAIDPDKSARSGAASAQPAKESWPRMPQASTNLTSSLRSLSISEQSTSRSANKGILKTAQKDYPSSPPATRSSAQTSVSGGDDDEATSQATTIVETEVVRLKAWTSGKTSNALFPTARATSKTPVNPGDWAGYVTATSNNDEIEGSNMFRTQFWNPNSKGYSVDHFRSDVVNGYICPFPSCSHGAAAYGAGSDIEEHIRLAHTVTCFRCPLCLKRFDKVAKLVGHMEASMKCRVKESNSFDSFLDEITGGFLKAKHVGEPKIHRPEKALVKHGQPTGGVLATVFKAKHPDAK